MYEGANPNRSGDCGACSKGRALRYRPTFRIASCVVLGIRLPRGNGLDFQTRLANANIRIPVAFMTGHGDIRLLVQAMKARAIDFLTKPFRDQDMLDAVTKTLECDRVGRQPKRRFRTRDACSSP
jgi:FixJ family two-component response regulator